MRRCQTPYCLNDASPMRRVCYKCRSRIYRKNNPYGTTFNDLRNNARRRGIPFELTIQEWIKWCDENNYLELRGTGPADMTVDRKDDMYGYVCWNLQMLTKAENSKKAADDRRKRKGWSVELKKAADDPF